VPFVSKAQQRWGWSAAGRKALGGTEAVKEWQGETPHSLPERSGMAEKHWIGGAIKHPGALSAAAKRNGLSKLQEAEKEKGSSSPKIRARGALGERFIRKSI